MSSPDVDAAVLTDDRLTLLNLTRQGVLTVSRLDPMSGDVFDKQRIELSIEVGTLVLGTPIFVGSGTYVAAAGQLVWVPLAGRPTIVTSP